MKTKRPNNISKAAWRWSVLLADCYRSERYGWSLWEMMAEREQKVAHEMVGDLEDIDEDWSHGAVAACVEKWRQRGYPMIADELEKRSHGRP